MHFSPFLKPVLLKCWTCWPRMSDLLATYVLHLHFPWSTKELLAVDKVRAGRGANFSRGQTPCMGASTWCLGGSSKQCWWHGSRTRSLGQTLEAAEVVNEMGEFLGYRNTGLAYLPVRSQCMCSCMSCHSSLLGLEVTAHTLSVFRVKDATCKWATGETSSPSLCFALWSVKEQLGTCFWSGQSGCQPPVVGGAAIN